ncbi:6-hydroxymethylpterin diphosphokinase MptE-like protein [Thalassotalea sediminis]|uniref:6-hydroxymethylpterin diphosphokinase MptE-like protein n=1 Tax=Thalassotalea sediminis TaxID=1759089 RepID=UPI0025730FCA|nr:6-hydroxymethylpterin diphosphokinase MptE-like protein [Thalassotalea sediminis]
MAQYDLNEKFVDVVSKITDIGKDWHSDDLVANALNNLPFMEKSFKDLPPLPEEKKDSAIIISAGPSLHKYDVLAKLKNSHYKGSIVAIDGSLVKCLKNGIIPDYVLTLDPHPTRIVRWFGDDNFEENTRNDDYFSRQDLDVEFRNNSILENQANIELINKYAPQIKLIICSSAPKNVVKRAIEAGFDMYWWNPIVDSPQDPNSLTRRIYAINKKSCMNTGGTVGTAAWVFANAILKIPKIALTGMDLGYHSDTPIEMTQTYYELHEFAQTREELEQLFPKFSFPLSDEEFYTDPTYFWYRHNFLDLLSRATGKTYNCSEAGTLFAENLPCITFSQFLNSEQ